MSIPKYKIEMLLISLQVDIDTIGLKSLHYTMLQHSLRSSLLYLPGFEKHDKEFADRTIGFVECISPLVIGISLMSHEYKSAAAITASLKENFSHIPIIWGGIHPTIAPEMCLEHADYICVGEGEAAIIPFVRALQGKGPPERCHSIWCRTSTGEIIKNPLAPLIHNLDEIAITSHLPCYSFIARKKDIVPLTRRLLKQYGRWRGSVYSIMGSRGCPFSCSYCCNNFLRKLYNSCIIRRRSVSNLISELSQVVLENPEVQFVNFQDDCFLACSDNYLEEFCRQYKERVRLPFIVRCIPGFLTEKRLRLLRDTGVAWVSMGLQSGSDHVLRRIYQRSTSTADFLEATRIIHKLRVAVYYDVIFDNPLETELDRLNTLLAVVSLPRPYFLQIFSLVAYPGTDIYNFITEKYPSKKSEYLTKNYHAYEHDNLNRMIRMAAYLSPRMIKLLVRLYKDNREGWQFRLAIEFFGFLSALLFEPLTSLRVIQISRKGSLAETLQYLPVYWRIGLSRYIKQFSIGYANIIERLVRDNLSGFEKPASCGKAVKEKER